MADAGNERVRLLTPAPLGAPSIAPNGIVPVYSSSNTIQPGSLFSIYGRNLAVAAVSRNGDFATTLGGTSVTVNNRPAYPWFVSPSQLNLQAPDDDTTGPVSVVVTTPAGTAASTVTLAQFAPSFSLLDGKHVAGILLRPDGSGAYGGGTYDIVGPTGSSLGYKTVAARAGDNFILSGCGFRLTDPAVPAERPIRAMLQLRVQSSCSSTTSLWQPAFSRNYPAGLTRSTYESLRVSMRDVPLRAIVCRAETPLGCCVVPAIRLKPPRLFRFCCCVSAMREFALPRHLSMNRPEASRTSIGATTLRER